MKKLFFVATTPFAVNSFLRLHLLSLAKDFRVTLCVNPAAYRIAPELEEVIEIIDIRFERKIAPLQDLVCLMRLVRLMRRVRPDAVHSITPKAGLLAMLASAVLGVPHRFHTFTGQVWVTKSGVFRRLLMMMDRIVSIFATQLFADSGSQARFLEEQGIAGRKRIQVLAGGSIAGVELDRFRPDPASKHALRLSLGCPDPVFIYLFVGRITREKGVLDLVNAFSRVVEAGVAAELWLVGPDEEGLCTRFSVEVSGCMHSIRYFGPTTEPEKFMAASDVLMLPSYREGFGSVIIEAAACGIPAIAYRINGVIDAIVENETGIFAETGDIRSLSNLMMRMAADEKMRIKLGEAAHLRAVNDFSSAAVTAAWEKFYSETLGDSA